MKKQRLEQLKINSKDAYKYMKSIQKEYLTGETLLDQIKFVYEFKENHSLDEVIYLCNEMKGHKESDISFTTGFFGIVTPVYIALFAFIGVIISGILNFTGNIAEKMIDIKLANDDTDVQLAFDLFKQVLYEISPSGYAIGIVLFLLLIVFFIRHRNGTKRIQYLAWLNSVKELYKEEKN